MQQSLDVESRTSFTPGKHCTTELVPSPLHKSISNKHSSRVGIAEAEMLEMRAEGKAVVNYKRHRVGWEHGL